jgi:hypothetical protein
MELERGLSFKMMLCNARHSLGHGKKWNPDGDQVWMDDVNNFTFTSQMEAQMVVEI